MENLIYIFGATFLISLISLIGVFTLSIKESFLKKILPLLIALSTGSLLGGVFFHILPEITKEAQNSNLIFSLILVGIILFYFIEKGIHWHHHHTIDESDHCSTCQKSEKIKPAGYMILFSDGFHNFLDGIMIASAFLVDFKLGLTATILIILHEIPQEIGDFGVLLHSGFSKKKALFFNFLSALSSLLGALLVVLFSSSFDNLSLFLTALAAGGFLYISMVDLIPEMHAHKHSKKSLSLEILFLFIGIALMFLLTFAENLF